MGCDDFREGNILNVRCRMEPPDLTITMLTLHTMDRVMLRSTPAYKLVIYHPEGEFSVKELVAKSTDLSVPNSVPATKNG